MSFTDNFKRLFRRNFKAAATKTVTDSVAEQYGVDLTKFDVPYQREYLTTMIRLINNDPTVKDRATYQLMVFITNNLMTKYRNKPEIFALLEVVKDTLDQLMTKEMHIGEVS